MSLIRKFRLLALCAGVTGILLVAACSSSPAPGPQASASSYNAATQRVGKYEPIIVQCFIDHNLIPASQLKKQSWYHSGKVTTNADFYNWYRFQEALVIKGKQLDEWVHDAAFNGTWPSSVCGPMPSVSS
jgi:hypothetical protein